MTNKDGRGRPRLELDARQRRDLARARARVTTLEAKLADANASLARVLADALANGASVRALAEELGLSKSTAHKLARSAS
jgi:predicted DNA binding protein